MPKSPRTASRSHAGNITTSPLSGFAYFVREYCYRHNTPVPENLKFGYGNAVGMTWGEMAREEQMRYARLAEEEWMQRQVWMHVHSGHARRPSVSSDRMATFAPKNLASSLDSANRQLEPSNSTSYYNPPVASRDSMVERERLASRNAFARSTDSKWTGVQVSSTRNK